MNNHLHCFKDYDVRGKVPAELNEQIAYRIARAYAEFVKPVTVVVGRDIRLTSESLNNALIDGLTDSGVNVVELGLCGTEQVYFATFTNHYDGGIMVTASHNPIDYNGFKFIRESAIPISSDTGLFEIKKLAEENQFLPVAIKGKVSNLDQTQQYIEHLLTYLSKNTKLKPFKIVTNSGNGMAGPVIDILENKLPFEFIKIQHQPNGHFPNGVPNPHHASGRTVTSNAILENKADFGIAWDGDFDRCCFFDHTGNYIDSSYIIGLLSSAFLKDNKNQKIVYEPRLTLNIIDQIISSGGTAVVSKTGYVFVKDKMREVDAIYGGEISAHHFFRSFGFCDSGMIPWILLTQIMSNQEKSLCQLIQNQRLTFPCSEEISVTVSDAKLVMENIKTHYQKEQGKLDEFEGISLEFTDWRFNLRCSSTEAKHTLRLNVEGRNNADLVLEKSNEIITLINRFNNS